MNVAITEQDVVKGKSNPFFSNQILGTKSREYTMEPWYEKGDEDCFCYQLTGRQMKLKANLFEKKVTRNEKQTSTCSYPWVKSISLLYK